MPIEPNIIEQQILNLHRTPFRQELARILKCSPDEEALKAFAVKSPDRFYQAVAILGKLAGFSDPKNITVENNFFLQIQQLSDAQLQVELQKSLQALQPKPLEVIHERNTDSDSSGDADDGSSDAPV